MVDGRSAGRRADVWLARRVAPHSRSAAARLIRSGRVRSLDRPLKPSTLLREGECLLLERRLPAPEGPPPPLPPVLYEDDRLLALDKPAGLLVHPSGRRFTWALVGLARRARPGSELHLAHRLDRDTSGVVLLAKDAEANRHLKEMFHAQYTEKVYWAFCRGDPEWNTVLVDAPLGPEGGRIRIRQAVRPDGQPARTRFFVLARFGTHALVACHPRTGRTHQLRVHLAHLGHPILGDRLYGVPEAVALRMLERGPDPEGLALAGYPRQALHARVLCIPHPDGHPLELRAPLARDLLPLLRGPLRKPQDPGTSRE